MKFVKQPTSLHLEKINFGSDKLPLRHGKLLPKTIRCIVCGPSNCGKTNLVIGLLLHPKGLHFRNVYVYSKTLYQPKYIFLEKVMSLVPGVSYFKYHDNEEVVSPDNASQNSVIIFDDVACENQNNIRDYFAMGRHKNIDCFYLNQTYSKVPKQLIRDNANLIILFKQDDINLHHVYDEHVNTDMTWLQFREMCSSVWKDSFSYLVINKDCQKNNGCYRKKFDTFIMVDD
ncbi:hypothetical protein JYU34_016644 [Plutella xylostella]|uniref:Uncharacterized protein n=1 Tax=Plutella xylostella TaxID=51655 RepID=A0ABQ7PQ67_PLUXY|nr:hypothetical protein JYU34_022682 [Plutella xylostella]KAG7299654.1 hypothetical protein JYU34_016644 [Plutella xylostella]